MPQTSAGAARAARSLANIFLFAVIASLVQLAVAVTCVKLFLDELHLSRQDSAALSSQSHSQIERWWFPFSSLLESFVALVWMLALMNMARGLTALLELVGGLLSQKEFLKAFGIVSRTFQICEIICLLVFCFVWKVPTNVGQMQPKLVIEVILLGAEMILREGLLAFLAVRVRELRKGEDELVVLPVPCKALEIEEAERAVPAEPAPHATCPRSPQDLPPPYSHVDVQEGPPQDPPPPYSPNMPRDAAAAVP